MKILIYTAIFVVLNHLNSIAMVPNCTEDTKEVCLADNFSPEDLEEKLLQVDEYYRDKRLTHTEAYFFGVLLRLRAYRQPHSMSKEIAQELRNRVVRAISLVKSAENPLRRFTAASEPEVIHAFEYFLKRTKELGLKVAKNNFGLGVIEMNKLQHWKNQANYRAR